MKAHHLSGSKADLSLCCAYWARPEVVHQPRPLGAPARRGNTVHAASDADHKGIPGPEHHDDTEALWLTLKAWIDAEVAAGRLFSDSEIPLLYDTEKDVASLCEIGELGPRDYLGVTAMKMPMRLDLVRVDRADGCVYVLDIKTGSRSGTASAHENVQLATMGLAAARFYGVPRANVGLIFPMKTKVHPPEWHELDAEALDLHAGRLHRVLRQLPLAEPNRGDWCWRCPIGPGKGVVSTCPAWQDEQAAE